MIKINLLERKKTLGDSFRANKYLKEFNWKLFIVAVLLWQFQGGVLKGILDKQLKAIEDEKGKIQKEYNVLKKFLEKNSSVKEELEKFKNQADMVKQRISYIEQLSSKRINLFPALKRIAEIIPQDIWLTEVAMSSGYDLTLRGMAEKHDSISGFNLALNNEEYFDGSFRINEVKTVEKDKNNQTIRSEQFVIQGKITKF